MIRHLHITMILICLSAGIAWSQTTYAVIVGISDYKILTPGKGGDLRFADDDARLFAALLQSKAGGTVPTRNIILLTERQATRDNILRAMQLFRQASASDRIIFYFSGHGDQGMLHPYDVGPGVFLQNNDVKSAFRQSSAHTKLLLADACKSGSMRRQAFPHAPTNSPNEQTKNVVVMMSSRANQFSQELSSIQHGAFTYYLVKGAAGEADLDHNRIVTMQELYRYMRGTIQKVTRNQQTPVVYGRFPASMPFTYIGT